MNHKIYLNKEIFFCEVGGIYIFLDSRNNKYFCLTDNQTKWFSEIKMSSDKNILSTKAETFAHRLIQKGILEIDLSKGKSIERCSLLPPQASIWDDTALLKRRSLTFIDVILISYVTLYTWFMWQTNRNHIHRVLSVAARWKQHILPSPHLSNEQVFRRTEIFHAIAPYLITTHDACFFRSLCLLRYLSLFHIDCVMVLGVRTHPFGAHCWVERDGVVLNDYRDNTIFYTKIMSI